jgi:carboxymethylenebutenolidase
MNRQVQELVEAHNKGQISRREFVRQAALLLGGVAVGGAVLASQPSRASSPAQGTAEPTLMATLESTLDPNIKVVANMVEFDVNGKMTPGYLAYPEGDGPFPGVIVIQEWWGLDDHIKAVTELMAKHGFAALAPDLYHGEVAEEPDEAQKLAMGLIMEQALGDVQGAVNYLIEQDYVGPKQIGVMGFCMGGGIAFRMAWAGENVGAVVSLYGGIDPKEEENFKDIKVPILALVGDKDRIAERVPGWAEKITGLGKTYEYVIYPGAAHAFFNDKRPSFNPEAAKDALPRLVNWFNKYLNESASMSGTMEATSEATSES